MFERKSRIILFLLPATLVALHLFAARAQPRGEIVAYVPQSQPDG